MCRFSHVDKVAKSVWPNQQLCVLQPAYAVEYDPGLLASETWTGWLYGTIKRLYWTTDAGQSTSVGPDGPWQAIWIYDWYSNITYNFWPTGGVRTMMVPVGNGDDYISAYGQPIKLESGSGVRLMRSSWPIGLDENISGYLWRDRMNLVSREDSQAEESRADIDLNIFIPSESPYPGAYSNGSNGNKAVGALGLGADTSTIQQPDDFPRFKIDTVTGQLVSEEKIASKSWFMHMGSVHLGQPGSLTLGGYEQNRALGNVGTFFLDGELPRVFLTDVYLDFETGETPYNETVGSVWQDIVIDEEAQSSVDQYGGPAGSVMVLPNAAAPYLYLPRGVCEAAAMALPVRWVSQVGLYVWDFSGQPDRTNRFINSPAYMGFTFSDEKAKNLTIKIPFKLLNLTLDDTPARHDSVNWGIDFYWPCKSWDKPSATDPSVSTYPGSRWPLGRAFLQGAFTGFNYDRKRFYMAQAPGPGMGQRIVVDDDSETIRSKPEDTFAETWQAYWTKIEPLTPNDTTGVISTSTSGIAKSAIVGIAIGASCGLCALLALLWFFCRRARRDRDQSDGKQGKKSGDEGVLDAEFFTGGKAEMDGKGVSISELGHHDWKSALGEQQPQELPSPFNPPMNSSHGFSDMVFELPDGNWVSHEKGEKAKKEENGGEDEKSK
ncbi:aspartic peptidase domain-containing protein [Colletotrichum godetiae]|uniref:Aspartic peptidase domain-containing protein n=1 Tax=Colletotrichum godetiae TaxID=1209918 RepID=A0AAJ0AMX7_9PEZI|nr:aspartic peptidase domain-containing protein [Colletotrichum godetiae]KAK1676830.1 aspartic peptidase domain-containing protein [Colletotrichum godetiae]